MPEATFRFYEELNDFLAPHLRKRDFPVPADGRHSVGEAISMLGVPRSAVDLVLVNGRSVSFSHPVQAGDRVSVYPVFERLNLKDVTRLPGRPLRRCRFLADSGLEGLATYMRGRGYDITVDPSLSGRERLAERSRREHRIILTLDAGLLEGTDVSHALVLFPGSVEEQFRYLTNCLDMEPEEAAP